MTDSTFMQYSESDYAQFETSRLHRFVRGQTEPFVYADWMAPLTRIWLRVCMLAWNSPEMKELADAYCAGLAGDFAAVDAYVGLFELAQPEHSSAITEKELNDALEQLMKISGPAYQPSPLLVSSDEYDRMLAVIDQVVKKA